MSPGEPRDTVLHMHDERPGLELLQQRPPPHVPPAHTPAFFGDSEYFVVRQERKTFAGLSPQRESLPNVALNDSHTAPSARRFVQSQLDAGIQAAFIRYVGHPQGVVGHEHVPAAGVASVARQFQRPLDTPAGQWRRFQRQPRHVVY